MVEHSHTGFYEERIGCYSIPAKMTEPEELGFELAELKQRDPQRYGYLKRYWRDAQQGLDNTSRNYARVTHIYGNIPEPKVRTRGLGHTLVLLAQLGVITVLTNRSNATIYDLIRYRSDRLAALGRLLSQ